MHKLTMSYCQGAVLKIFEICHIPFLVIMISLTRSCAQSFESNLRTSSCWDLRNVNSLLSMTFATCACNCALKGSPTSMISDYQPMVPHNPTFHPQSSSDREQCLLSPTGWMRACREPTKPSTVTLNEYLTVLPEAESTENTSATRITRRHHQVPPPKPSPPLESSYPATSFSSKCASHRQNPLSGPASPL